MDVMEKVAIRHKFKVLLHEKPFAGINGSGKHNNWSLITNNGTNLLAPTQNPQENLQFLTFFVNVIKAVHDHADLMRASIASAGNEHRLGANEAPPAIMSIFIGSQMTEVLESLLNNKSTKNTSKAASINVKKIPEILLDNTDRNRTSPLAFTGNKFELRAVGSSANSANPMTILNTIVASQLNKFKVEVDKLIKKGEKKDVAIMTVIKRYIKESKAIRFEGNGYSDEWAEEAKKRGLSNIKTTPKALDVLLDPKTDKLFEETGIFSKRESHARHEILLESYFKKLQIEARVMGDLVDNVIIPTAINYQTTLIENVKGLKEIGLGEDTYAAQLEIIKKISGHVNFIRTANLEMVNERKKANNIEDIRDKSIAYDEKVKSYFDPIRYHVDKLEQLVDDSKWPLPKFRELLFLK
jgi:glutamine synthetase